MFKQNLVLLAILPLACASSGTGREQLPIELRGVWLTNVDSRVLENRTSIAEAIRCSRLSQEIVFYHASKRIDFVTTVDWHEERTLLKVAFPMQTRVRVATYEHNSARSGEQQSRQLRPRKCNSRSPLNSGLTCLTRSSG